MTNEAIRPGCHQLMIGSKASIHSPLAPKGARSGPRKKRGEHKEDYAKRYTPGPRLHFPKAPLPQDSIADADENDSPSSALVQWLRRLLLFIDNKKRQHPKEPASNKNREGEGRHYRDCSSAESPADSNVYIGAMDLFRNSDSTSSRTESSLAKPTRRSRELVSKKSFALCRV